MQNYNAPPPAKKGLSKGCIIGMVAAVLGLAVLVVLAAGGGLLYFMSQGSGRSVNVSVDSPGSAKAGDAGDADDEADAPRPTAGQSAAVSGGQSARWEQQEINWTVPQRWAKQQADSTTLVWRSPGSSDAANLIANVTPVAADFPADISINAYYQRALSDKQNGRYDEVRWLRLGGVKGVVFRESSPEDPEGIRRLQWIGYRDYKGQKQQVSVMLSTLGKYFARHEDAMYGVLYSTEF